MIASILRLLRIRLALVNGAAAVGGYLLHSGTQELSATIAVFTGVALLAGGGSAFNQIMEADLDRLMSRTSLRPVACGRMSAATAAVIGGMAILPGSLVLLLFGGFKPVLLGLLALAWYLGVYTPLKRRTSLALPVGALCGAMPPLVGWALAGGSLVDHRIWLLTGLLYLWQIPHFWMLQSKHRRDYQDAGIPLFSPSAAFSRFQSPFAVWIIALAAASLLLPTLGLIPHSAAIWYTLLSLLIPAFALLRFERALFVCLNLFPVMVSLAIAARCVF